MPIGNVVALPFLVMVAGIVIVSLPIHSHRSAAVSPERWPVRISRANNRAVGIADRLRISPDPAKLVVVEHAVAGFLRRFL